MTVTLQDVNETLLPRRYQEEIFTRAREGNVIAALDTGSGKTYISTLLIKWISAQEVNKHKNIIFLVPKVALVEQQGDFIAKQTPLIVSKACGATAMDLSDRAGWQTELGRANVLIMTAQIFLNILTHSLWSLDKVSLIVFDECHHTRKNHAYNGIMREYFQYPKDQRPKIFGMTASPIWNPKDAVMSLATLERNLDAKVIAVREHVEELMGHSPKPQEILHEYPAPSTYPEYMDQSLWDQLDLMSIPPEIDIPAEKIWTRYQVTYQSLGPYGAEVYLYYEIKQRVTALIQQASTIDLECLAGHKIDPGSDDFIMHDPMANVHPEIMELQRVLSRFKDKFEDENNPDIVPITVHLKWCSPKVRVLIDLLFAHYTSSFQGIVFVEQRHVASALAKILPRVPQLDHLIRCAQLIGHGTNGLSKSHATGMALKVQQDIVKSFREGQVNLLVATSVAEEGLDFPACDVVVRFDPLQHMVGYLQSRGRARHKTSTFVIMVQQGQTSQMDRYKSFFESEPQLRLVYQARDRTDDDQTEDNDDDHDHPSDLAERERYVVQSTGAVLTYNSAIGLLNHLCSLIPRDKFTPIQLPQYSGDFTATVQLPPSLPLPPESLKFVGPLKHSKKEAKRAVAFAAVKKLHALNVFDDFLLPARSATGGDNEDGDGRPIQDSRYIPETMDVLVRDPWTRGATQWLHIVYVDGVPTTGLVTGTQLPPVDLVCGGSYVCTGLATQVCFDPWEEWRQRRAMEDFTRMGVWWCVTGRGISLPLTCNLVPITRALGVDFDAIYRAVLDPFGSYDWSGIGEQHCGHLLVTFNREYGRPFILRRIRTDVSPMSPPPPGSRADGFSTYREYWLQKYTRKDNVPEVPEDGPCIEGQPLSRHTSCVYRLDGEIIADDHASKPALPTVLFPQAMCRWAPISEEIYKTFRILPELTHRITDMFRARTARIELNLPPIVDDLLVQALTLPSANAGFNNQRLETLGDSVLKLGTAVHLFNKFPHRHEGQLDILRRNSVANRTLLARALEHRLHHYLTSEPQSMRLWRYTLSLDVDPSSMDPHRYTRRTFPRRSLQDCMEAILGASFATGGIDMALRTGTALGLCFGGPLPWHQRYGGKLGQSEASALFSGLQETLGYQFRCGHLLLEAVTHPSFRSWESSSYQRLEFLGDALIDLVVMRYLYNKFPEATSGQLSWARSRAVCAPALASVAIKRLNLHKMLLINNVELSVAISKYVPILTKISPEDIIVNSWKQDPPKAISDVLESVLGAVLVDSDYDFEKACTVAEIALQPLLDVLTPNLPRDPVSELMIWAAQSGCRKISYRKSQSRPELNRNDSISVVIHDIVVVGPITGNNMSLNKGLAAEQAYSILNSSTSSHRLPVICSCSNHRQNGVVAVPDIVDDVKNLDDETEEGFAALAQVAHKEASDTVAETQGFSEHVKDEDEDPTWEEEQEVENMMQLDIPVSLMNPSTTGDTD